MDESQRNAQPCWTCRLLNYTCDEDRPNCTSCHDENRIPCYGYGEKPVCMDGAENERDLLDYLTFTIKNSRMRKSVPPAVPPRKFLIPSRPRDIYGVIESSSLHTPNPASETHINNDPVAVFSGSDSTLLMHYLDYVFPLQFPTYRPEGGRGWLLALLFESKAFYHAALALSAQNYRTGGPTQSSEGAMIKDQEHRLQSCLKLLDQSARDSYSDDSIGMLAAVVHVMFLELFNQNDAAWKAHLQAAIKMYLRGQDEAWREFGMSYEARRTISAGDPVPENDISVQEVLTGFNFTITTLFWLEVISSITVGITPIFLLEQSQFLSQTSRVQFGEVFACEDWVVQQIAHVTRLHELSTAGLDIKAPSYVLTIDTELRPYLNCSIDQTPRKIVTKAYTYMAFVYLHLVVHGFQQFHLLGPIIPDAVAFLQQQTPEHVLSALVPALFVLGTVADLEDRPFFREIFTKPPVADPCLPHRIRILPILETIWEKRCKSNLTWSDCISLSGGLLLI